MTDTTVPRERSECHLVEMGFTTSRHIRVNGRRLCTTDTEQQDTPGGLGQAACNAATYAMKGMKKIVSGVLF